MKTRLLLITALILLIPLAACKAQPTPVYVTEGAERDGILADTDVFVRHIQAGMETKDFTLFSKDFDSDMQKAMTPDVFEQIYKRYESYGASTSLELINVQVAGNFYAVRYKVTYADKVVIMRLVVPQTTPRLVSGLWFE